MSVTKRQKVGRIPMRTAPLPNYRLTELRRNRGWSRERLGFEAGGVHHKTIGDIEDGRTRRPQARTMFLLAQALGTTVADLESGVAKERATAS